MTDIALNPRYANWCRVNGNTPEQQQAADRAKYPGACNLAFVEWNRERLREASAAIPHAFFMGHLSDHDAYDAWLTAYVDAQVAA